MLHLSYSCHFYPLPSSPSLSPPLNSTASNFCLPFCSIYHPLNFFLSNFCSYLSATQTLGGFIYHANDILNRYAECFFAAFVHPTCRYGSAVSLTRKGELVFTKYCSFSGSIFLTITRSPRVSPTALTHYHSVISRQSALTASPLF